MPETQLTPEWHPGYIWFSYAAAVLASYSTVTVLQHRLGIAATAVAAFTLSVCGIWSMHFVGMEAMSLGIVIDFDPLLTVFSGVFAFICTGAGFLLVQRHVAVVSSVGFVRDITLDSHIEAILTAPHGYIGLSGLCIAAGVCSMHYTGQIAMRSIARAEANVGVIVASVIIAIVAATAALYLAFVLPISRRYALPTSLVAGVAVCGMHYTAMYGFTYYVDTTTAEYARNVVTCRTRQLGFYVLGASMSISFAVLAYASWRHQQAVQSVLEAFERYVPTPVVEGILAENGMTTGDVVDGDDDDVSDSASIQVSSVQNRPASRVSSRARKTQAYSPRSSMQTQRSSQKAAVRRTRNNLQSLQMRRCFCTVLFVDIVNFTGIIEGMADGTLVSHMTDFNGYCSDAIMSRGGVVDKFLGDAVMAVWNTVYPVADHAVQAVRAARHCTEYRDKLFTCRAGVQTGRALMGNVGSAKKLNFTVIGDTVNQAARIEALTRHYDAQVLLGEATARALDDHVPTDAEADEEEEDARNDRYHDADASYEHPRVTAAAAGSSTFVVRTLDQVVVKGKTKSIYIFELMAMDTEAPDVVMNARHKATAYEECFNLFCAGNIVECVTALRRHMRRGPGRLGLSASSDIWADSPQNAPGLVASDGTSPAGSALRKTPTGSDRPHGTGLLVDDTATQLLLSRAVKELRIHGDTSFLESDTDEGDVTGPSAPFSPVNHFTEK